MKTARERFFPAPSTPRTSSGTSFLANSDNALHRSDSCNSGERLRGQDSAVLSALDNLQNTGMNRPPTQMGYTALMRKSGSAGNIVRPGTAAPRIGEERGLNLGIENRKLPVIAPSPKKHHQFPSPFAFRSGSFGSEPLGASGDNNSSKSPDNLNEERQEENFKMPFPKNMNIKQRVLTQPEPSQYQAILSQRRAETSPMQSDYGDQDRSSMESIQQNHKRMREPDDIGDPDFMERNGKRFKTQELEEDEKMSQHGSISGHLERPSSTASSAMGSYHGRSDTVVVNNPPPQRSQVERQENPDLNPTILSHRTHVGLPGRRRSEPIGLDRLLGPGSNDLLDQYADKYEALLKKWSDCSVDEWKAGAEEISAQFSKMLDFAKDYLDKKLKTHSNLNAVLDSHCEILRERTETMEFARQQMVKEGRNVLG